MRKTEDPYEALFVVEWLPRCSGALIGVSGDIDKKQLCALECLKNSECNCVYYSNGGCQMHDG